MNCPKCQHELREGAQFCDLCGYSTASFNTPTEIIAAPSLATTLVQETPADLLVGRVLGGKYELLKLLGAGGMGAVYRARRMLIDDEVAVKILLPKLVAEDGALERFHREARAAARLNHPNIVTIHDFGEQESDGAPAYIVMELAAGESLRDLLRREKRLTPERAVAYMREICAGVGAAHKHNIVHRDLKPDNVIVKTGQDTDCLRVSLKVIDFGIAKLRDAANDGNTLTQAGAVMGTPYYMSPEQCRGDALDARADVYSLGAMLYEMLAGAPPFQAATPTGVLAKHLVEPPPPFAAELNISPALEAAIRRALAKDADERQTDAHVFGRELRDTLTANGEFAALGTAGMFAPGAIGSTSGRTSPVPDSFNSGNAPSAAFNSAPFNQSFAAIVTQNRVLPFILAGVVLLLVGGGALGFLAYRKAVSNAPPPVVQSAAANQPIDGNSESAAPLTIVTSEGIEFVQVPTGHFLMGSGLRGDDDEKPVHDVAIGAPFLLGKYEVTQAQWRALMKENPSRTIGDNLPVEFVTWDAAKVFIERLNALNDGYRYRLPSEAEWEYAARAHTTGEFAGDLDATAWYYDNSGGQLHPVGTKQPNAFGLYDMQGNVWEWCEDWYHDNYNNAPRDGSAWLEGGEKQFRVRRGGSFRYAAAYQRSAYRDGSLPDGLALGLRLVAEKL